MKLIRLVLACVLVLAAAAIVFASNKKPEDTGSGQKSTKPDSSQGTSIKWLSLDQGLKRAEAENKYVLVDITASWCGWCKKMEREAFSDTSIIKLVNSKYVPVKLWGDSENMLEIEGYKISEKDLATSQFGVTGYPTFVFLCPDARGIAKVPGYRNANDFMQLLSAVNEFNCDSAKAADQANPEKK